MVCSSFSPTIDENRLALQAVIVYTTAIHCLFFMETWKVKRKQSQNRGGKGTAWKPRLISVLMLLATLVGGVYAFPAYWNMGADALAAKTHWAVPKLPNASFRLGLDLQGGTHLIYDADMKQIPLSDRTTALEGVRDVIERRVNAFGVSEPLVQTTNSNGTYRIVVELAGVLNVKDAIAQIGETPVLEFKEPGTQLDHAPTDADNAKLAALQATDKKAAEAVLARAKKGENFDALVKELGIDQKTATATTADGSKITSAASNGIVEMLTEKSPQYAAIAQAIQDTRVKPGQVINKVIETPEGLNVVKYTGSKDTKEMQLSHILICFEGKTGCQDKTSQIEASVKINQLKKDATPQNFADLAQKESTDKSGKGDGDLGWIAPGSTIPAFEIAALKTPVGAISDVVETDFGYHIIYKRAERPLKAYSIQRILLKNTSMTDILPPSSPWKNTELSGKDLTRASVQFDQNTNSPHVALQFNSEGADLFGKLTAAHIGQPIAIFLDGQPISTPTVQSAIYGGQATITGNFTVDQAKLLAQRLNAGALPVPITLLSQETVGPTLGLASLHKSIAAALIGFALVGAFMILLYRVSGVLATLALVLYAFLNLATYRFFGVTMTLSGIAGLVLSLGIAVDANVLIFERMKDEFRSGRDLPATLREGFRRAWPPIRDGHMTTFISAIVLYSFSSSFVRGFALTLAIGVALSLFTAITVTRNYLRATTLFRLFQKPWLYALKKKADLTQS